MARKLNTVVHAHRVEKDEQGRPYVMETRQFGPEDDMSKLENAWAVKAITNPDVWADDGAGGAAADTSDTGGSGSTGDDGPPPKGGAGSGAPAWREYAAKNDVEVPADASREDVIAALEGAGVRTE